MLAQHMKPNKTCKQNSVTFTDHDMEESKDLDTILPAVLQIKVYPWKFLIWLVFDLDPLPKRLKPLT